MQRPEPLRRLKTAEYLQIERAAEFKSEFFDGEMFAMAGGTPEHTLKIVISLAEVFAKVSFTPSPIRAPGPSGSPASPGK